MTQMRPMSILPARCRIALSVLAMAYTMPANAPADARLTGIAARSVHLSYPTPPVAAAVISMRIDQSTPGSFFMACGWNDGYFGLQELRDGRKTAIFSVWDSADDDPKSTPAEQRVRVLHRHPDVRIGRFGGEGSGGQSFFPLDWKAGDTHRFLVAAWPMGDRTAYAGYLLPAGAREWIHLITFSTPSRAHSLRGIHSFVEDFLRNRASAELERRASFGPVWVRDREGAWKEILNAMFTADGNRSEHIDAGVREGRFHLATGGSIQNTGTPLWNLITLPAELGDLSPLPELVPPPADVPSGE